jgi:hypothetical protein
MKKQKQHQPYLNRKTFGTKIFGIRCPQHPVMCQVFGIDFLPFISLPGVRKSVLLEDRH